MNRKLFAGVTAAVVLTVGIGLSGQAAQTNPTIGTWKLNVAKSKYDPANLAPKSQTTKIEAAGAGTKATTQGVDYAGKPISYSYTANYDGKDYPITGTGPNGADTIAVTRVDANTLQSTLKAKGKTVLTNRSVYTGTSRTITSTGTTASGQPIHNVAVYDRQ